MKFIVFLLIIISFNSFSAETDKAQNSPQFIVHLLDYLAGDYGGAVQNGKVVSKDEYSEQMEFIETVYKLSTSLPEVKKHTAVVSKIAELKKKIENKADAKLVAANARDAQKELILALNIPVAPSKLPNFENGKKLFANNCISCHGQNGNGDGPNGAGLDPKPANFHDKDRMKEISIFHCYNTIRLGVPGTGMAPWPELNDKDVWDLATYVMGLRFKNNSQFDSKQLPQFSLNEITTSTDEQLKNKLNGSDEDKDKALAFVRTDYNQNNDNDGIKKARTLLNDSKESYEKGNFPEAEKIAVSAYLEGIEPIEPALKANKAELLPKIEAAMADFRKEVKKENNLSAIESKITSINLILDEVETALVKEQMSFAVAFSGSFAIILREGFEAVLIIITLLSVLKAFNNRKAVYYVHAGWILALGVGVLTWLASGALINISGMGQEMIEAVTSVLAVVILLYFGFWLHRQTEISRWKKFIEDKVQSALDNSNLLAIGSISFMATYREAFETVLFIRTIWTQSGVAGKNGIGMGLAVAFAVISLLSVLALKYSAKIPVKKLFRVSAWIMCVLAFILAGKAVHAFQAVGVFGISFLPIKFSFDLIGLHSTVQTIFAQLLVGALSIFLLKISQKKA